jgi:ribonucleoside-diphosphate reductase alpha chain
VQTGSYDAPADLSDDTGTDIDVETLAQSAPVEKPQAAAEEPEPFSAPSGGTNAPTTSKTALDAPLCFTCGVKMRPAGSCYVCESCGSTSGCS